MAPKSRETLLPSGASNSRPRLTGRSGVTCVILDMPLGNFFSKRNEPAQQLVRNSEFGGTMKELVIEYSRQAYERCASTVSYFKEAEHSTCTGSVLTLSKTEVRIVGDPAGPVGTRGLFVVASQSGSRSSMFRGTVCWVSPDRSEFRVRLG